MGKNTRPRKPYRQKYKASGFDAIAHVVKGIAPTPSTDRDVIMTANHGSMHSLTRGNGTGADVNVISRMLNMCTVLCEMRVGYDFAAEIREAVEAHHGCRLRQRATGRYVYTGREMGLINHALLVNEAQLRVATVKQIEQAMVTIDAELRKPTNYQVDPPIYHQEIPCKTQEARP